MVSEQTGASCTENYQPPHRAGPPLRLIESAALGSRPAGLLPSSAYVPPLLEAWRTSRAPPPRHSPSSASSRERGSEEAAPLRGGRGSASRSLTPAVPSTGGRPCSSANGASLPRDATPRLQKANGAPRSATSTRPAQGYARGERPRPSRPETGVAGETRQGGAALGEARRAIVGRQSLLAALSIHCSRSHAQVPALSEGGLLR